MKSPNSSNHLDKVIRLPSDIIRRVKEELGNHKKIAAIKLVRAHVKDDLGVGLKEAKFACERLECEMGIKPMSQNPPTAWTIRPCTLIKAIKFDLGDGELDVDLETMEMRVLMGLESMGISEVSRVLDLVKILRAFSEGANINIDSEWSDSPHVSIE